MPKKSCIILSTLTEIFIWKLFKKKPNKLINILCILTGILTGILIWGYSINNEQKMIYKSIENYFLDIEPQLKTRLDLLSLSKNNPKKNKSWDLIDQINFFNKKESKLKISFNNKKETTINKQIKNYYIYINESIKEYNKQLNHPLKKIITNLENKKKIPLLKLKLKNHTNYTKI